MISFIAFLSTDSVGRSTSLRCASLSSLRKLFSSQSSSLAGLLMQPTQLTPTRVFFFSSSISFGSEVFNGVSCEVFDGVSCELNKGVPNLFGST